MRQRHPHCLALQDDVPQEGRKRKLLPNAHFSYPKLHARTAQVGQHQ